MFLAQTDAGWGCEFRYQPDKWKTDYRFAALRYEKTREEPDAGEPEQYQLFATSQYKYRVFVTDMAEPIDFVVWFYNRRGSAENPIKEANNDAGLTAHPLAPLRWERQSFPVGDAGVQPEPLADATALPHTTLAASRLRFPFVAAKIWRHSGRTGVSYSDHYEEKGLFQRIMDWLRKIAPLGTGFAPVMLSALR